VKKNLVQLRHIYLQLKHFLQQNNIKMLAVQIAVVFDLGLVCYSETEASDESGHMSDDSDDDWDCINDENSEVSSNSDSEYEEENPNLKSKIQGWAVDCGVTHAQLNKLLPILKELDSSISLTAKTLLSTSDDFRCRYLSGGDYIYFGIVANISFLLANKGNIDMLNAVELALNVDVVPLFFFATLLSVK
jgi:hypothetical protein